MHSLWSLVPNSVTKWPISLQTSKNIIFTFIGNEVHIFEIMFNECTIVRCKYQTFLFLATTRAWWKRQPDVDRRPSWRFQLVDIDQTELFYWSTSTILTFSTGRRRPLSSSGRRWTSTLSTAILLTFSSRPLKNPLHQNNLEHIQPNICFCVQLQ